MKTATTALTTTVSRRAWLSRLLLAAAVAPVVGVRLADDAGASKKGKKKRESVKEKAKNGQDACVADGGKAEVEERPGGTSVSCTGGDSGDWTCVYSSKATRCYQGLTTPPTVPLEDVSAPPTDGANEDPTDGGGTNAGGGAHVPPSGGVNTGGGGSDPVLE